MRKVQPSHRQPDLFASPDPPVTMALVELTELTLLISTLLMEAAVNTAATEVGNEDHA